MDHALRIKSEPIRIPQQAFFVPLLTECFSMNTPWQFLLQTEDSPDWSPLCVTDPLAENRYRLAVKNAPPNLEVDIVFTQITDGSSYLLPHKKCCTRRVNAQGFLLLSPLTHLAPGTWQIRCLPSVMAEMLGQTGQASLEFTVTPAIQLANQSLAEEPEMLSEEPKTFSQSLRELQLPEALPLPTLSFEAHHGHSISEEEVASLTPELEAISHVHYDHLLTVIPPLISENELQDLFSEIASITPDTTIPETTINEELETPLVVEEERPEVSSLPAETLPNLAEISSVPVPELQEDVPVKVETEVTLFDEQVNDQVDAQVNDQVSVISQSETVKYEKNYLVQVHYLDSNTSITIDVAVIEDPHHPPCHLHLPNPAQMPRRLQLPLLAKKQVLPPKLSPSSTASKSSIRFKKLEPHQQAS